MKDIALKIYNNPLLLYTIGALYSAFVLFVAYKDLADFITREAVVGYSLLTFLLTTGLLIKEFGNTGNSKQEDNQTKHNYTSKVEENQTSYNSSYNDFDEEEEEVIYEWDEEEMTQKEEVIDTSKEKIETLEAKIKQLEQELVKSKETAPKTQNNETKEVENPWANTAPEATGFEPIEEDRPPIG